jgi:hypothetical protein
MNRSLKQTFVLGLVAGLLLLGGLGSAQATTHALHHAHHQAATHATAFCSWLCAAGQGAEAQTVWLAVDRAPSAPAVSSVELAISSPTLRLTLTRGPPILSR